jgi:hypothetical protein
VVVVLSVWGVGGVLGGLRVLARLVFGVSLVKLKKCCERQAAVDFELAGALPCRSSLHTVCDDIDLTTFTCHIMGAEMSILTHERLKAMSCFSHGLHACIVRR